MNGGIPIKGAVHKGHGSGQRVLHRYRTGFLGSQVLQVTPRGRGTLYKLFTALLIPLQWYPTHCNIVPW